MTLRLDKFVIVPEFSPEVRTVVEDLRVILWQSDCRTRKFTWVNRYAEEMLGYPLERWLNEAGFWAKIIHPDDHTYAITLCQKAVAEAKDHQLEYRVSAADGRTVWLRQVVRVVKDSGNQVFASRGVMIDITEQREAENALRESEQRFGELAENLREVLWMRDTRNNRTLYVSPAYERVWGRTCASLYEDPDSFLAAVHPDDRHMLSQPPPQAVRERLAVEYRVILPDGTVRHIADRAFPVFDASGEICRLVGIAEDVTERKLAEAATRESQERFRRIFEEGPIAMVLLGLGLRVKNANQAFCNLIGVGQEDLETIDLAQISHPDELAGCTELVRQLFAGAIPNYRIEKRIIRRNGDVIWVDLFGTAVRDENGTALYALAMVVDITERKRAEQSLRDLSTHLIHLQDQTRRNLARDLHDSSGQNLAALQFSLSRLSRASLPSELQSIVADSLSLAEKALNEIRTISHLLHPPLLDELGLQSAVRSFTHGFSERSGIPVHLEVGHDLGRRLAPKLETAIFRIIQEGLTNTHRHSGATQCWVSLGLTDDRLSLEIRDDGVGLPDPSWNHPELSPGISGVGPLRYARTGTRIGRAPGD